MSDEDDSQKWCCDYCTYLNFPSSQKCTLCRGRKPVGAIMESGMKEECPDIYALAKLTESESPGRDNGSPLPPEAVQDPTAIIDANGRAKWACLVCTYLNWPKSTKCITCHTPRGRASPVRQTASPPAANNNGNGDNKDDANHSDGDGSARKRASPKRRLSGDKTAGSNVTGSSSPSDGNNTNSSGPANPDKVAGSGDVVSPVIQCLSPKPESYISDQPSTSSALDHRIIARKLQKWTCASCTYENWPKNAHCVMCYMPKADSPSTRAAASRQQSAASPGSPSLDEGGAAAQSNKDKKRSLSSIAGGGGNMNKSPRSASSSTESINSSEANATAAMTEEDREVRLRRLKRRLRDLDWLFLNACNAVVVGIDADPVEAYLSAGGDPARPLTLRETQILMRPGIIEIGHTLLHLAVRYHREDLLALLLTCSEQSLGMRRIKKVPCHVCPELASDIRRQLAINLRQRKGEFPCFFFMDYTTFSLPSAICDLKASIQERLFNELLDQDVQKALEEEAPIINWSLELTDRLGSRLYALWNRTAGDCLLDSVLQATWGVFDSENSLRQALAESLNDSANVFYPRWKEYEAMVASTLPVCQFALDDSQWARDWDSVLQLASKPGSALEQAHVFALAHIVRRPIIVYGIRTIKSFRGETIGIARFEGVYLPLLWESSFCYRSPICLGYTRGHFSALVPMEPDSSELGSASRIRESSSGNYVYLPLCDADGHILPIHFLSQSERGHESQILRSWLDCTCTEGGLLVCKMKLHRQPPIIQQMLDDWIEYYHRLGQATHPHEQILSFVNLPSTSRTGLNRIIQPPAPMSSSISGKSSSSNIFSSSRASYDSPSAMTRHAPCVSPPRHGSAPATLNANKPDRRLSSSFTRNATVKSGSNNSSPSALIVQQKRRDASNSEANALRSPNSSPPRDDATLSSSASDTTRISEADEYDEQEEEEEEEGT